MSKTGRTIGSDQLVSGQAIIGRSGELAGGPLGSISGGGSFQRAVFRYWELSATGKGTEISLGAAFFELTSDVPVDVYLNDSPEPWQKITTLTLIGQIDKIWVKRRSASVLNGAVRVRYGYPAEAAALMGPERHPIWLPSLSVTVTGFTWPLSTTDLDPVGTAITIPSSLVTEACWFEHCYFERSSGTISQVSLMANVGSYVLQARKDLATPAASIEWEPIFPLKMCTDWRMRLVGSSEAGNTTVDGAFRFRRF